MDDDSCLSLLDAKLLLEKSDELVHLLRRVEVLLDAVPLGAALDPRRELGALLVDAELAEPFEREEPWRERHEGHVDEPELVAAEEGPVAERALQGLENLHHLLARLQLRLPLGPPQPRAAVVDLLVDVVGPEAGLRARVGVGGQEGRARAGEGLVDVLDDDEGLADGAAVVEQHGDLLVDGVGAQEEVALVAQVLLQVLVRQRLLVQRDAAALTEWAHPEVQQLETRHRG
jgi:hypothetical protein